MSKNWITFFTIILFKASFLDAQSLKECFYLGVDAQKRGAYADAIDFYQRVIFFDENQEFLQEAIVNTANIFVVMENFNRAVSVYHQALPFFKGKDRLLISLQIIQCLLATHDYTSALHELYELEAEMDGESELWHSLFYLKGITYLGMEQIDSSFKYFHLMAGNHKEARDQIDIAFKIIKKGFGKKEKTAYVLSLLFPGAGQLYAGDVRNALNVFLLSAGFGFLTVYSAITISPTTAILNIMPWWSRYHIGGLNRSKESVRLYKMKKNEEAYSLILVAHALSMTHHQ